jgi:DNA-binding PadR family transcriptional regulator
MEIRRSTYFVLAALLDGPLHGYAIIGRAAELSDGDVRLSTGTLFGALDRLVASGLVQAGEEEKVDGRVRRAYTLTQDGHEALSAEASRMRRAAHVVEARVAGATT